MVRSAIVHILLLLHGLETGATVPREGLVYNGGGSPVPRHTSIVFG